MGTLGCINDMMRRDKENRELRRASRERLNETRNRLLDVKGKRYFTCRHCFINRGSSCPILQMNHVRLWRYILFSR